MKLVHVNDHVNVLLALRLWFVDLNAAMKCILLNGEWYCGNGMPGHYFTVQFSAAKNKIQHFSN
jgi:hypothetical protein